MYPAYKNNNQTRDGSWVGSVQPESVPLGTWNFRNQSNRSFVEWKAPNKDHRCYGFITNPAFRRKKKYIKVKWCGIWLVFIIIINRRSQDRLEIQNFSFRELTREIVLNTRRLKFRIYARPRNILHVLSFFFAQNFEILDTAVLNYEHKSLEPWKSTVKLSFTFKNGKNKIDCFFLFKAQKLF